MNRFILRWIINAIALYIAVMVVPGISMQSGNWLAFLGLAFIFGVVNALFGPLIKLLTCPLILLTLGLFTLVVNTFLFWFAGWVGTGLGIGFTVNGFWPAFLGSLVVSFVSVILTLVLKDELKKG